MRRPNRVDQRLGILGDVPARILEQGNLTIQIHLADGSGKLPLNPEWILAGRNSNVGEDITGWIWPSHSRAASHLDDLRFRYDGPAGKLDGFSLLVLHRPVFEGLDHKSSFGKCVGIFLNRSAALVTRGIDLSAFDPNLKPRRATFSLNNAET